MRSAIADLGHAWRVLLQRPWLSLAAVLSLGLAMGGATAVFGVWHAVMRYQMPVRRPDRLVAVYNLAPTVPGTGYMRVSHLDFLDYADEKQVFSGAYALFQNPVALGLPGRSVRVIADVVSGGYFDILGVRAARGALFHAAQTGVDGAGALAVLSQDFFERQFGGNPAVLGTPILLNGSTFTVIGVAPAGFAGTGALQAPDLWAPMSMHAALLRGPVDSNYLARNAQFFGVVARLRPGATQEQARVAVRLMGERLAREYPKTDRLLTATTLPLPQTGIDPNQRQLYTLAFAVLLSVVGLVLLIACANVSGLLLARVHGRRHEIAVRMALGATPGRLLRQHLAESLLLGLAAGATGLALAVVAQRALWAYRPAAVERAAIQAGWGGPVTWFAAGLVLFTTLLSGLAPALLAARSHPAPVLRTPSGDGGHHARLRAWLLCGETAFSITALILAGLFVASLRHLRATGAGFDAPRLAGVQFDASGAGFSLTSADAQSRLLNLDRALLDRVSQLPGVVSATVAGGAPMAATSGRRGFRLFEQAGTPDQGWRIVNLESIWPGSFFRTMGIRLLAGRDFLPTDNARAPRVMIVNQTMARTLWPGQDALGKRIIFHDEDAPTTVVGVVHDSIYDSLTEGPITFAYLPLAQEPVTALGLAVRSSGTPAALLPELTRAVAEVNPELATWQARTATTAIAGSLWAERMGAILLSLLSALATLLACIGIYAAAAYAVRQRWRELGIRMALGATRRRLFASVLGAGLLPVAGGLVAGILAALALGRLSRSLLFGVGAGSPAIVLGYAMLFVGVAILALMYPARTATRADPAAVLRETR
jgi:putative ABC transport system permease protein